MRISIIQPCFVPWLGYFEQIAVGETFVYLDDVQYTRQNWRNNNQLKAPFGVGKIVIPVKKTSISTLLNEVKVSYNQNWENLLSNKLKEWYKKSPYYGDIIDLISPIINTKYEKLVDFNYALNNAILDYLGIDTKIRFSSEVPRTTHDRNLRIIEICQFFGGKTLYDGKSAANFIDNSLFEQHGIEVMFQDYQHAPYKQRWGEFTPYMSILDLMMNEGKGSKAIIMSNPLPDKLINR